MTPSDSIIRSVLIVGCGYLGRRAAERWHQAGIHVSAITRSPETAAQFSVAGWQPIQMDLASPSSSIQLPEVDAVLWAVGYDRTAAADRQAVWIDGLKWVLNNLKQPLKKFIYISSTSVYGNVEHEVVTEETAASPVTEGGQCCLQAEQLVLGHFSTVVAEAVVAETVIAEAVAAKNMAAKTVNSKTGIDSNANDSPTSQDTAIILRLAGIYGPNRLLRRIMDLKKQVPLPGDPNHWLNLIHVDDAVSLVTKLADQQTTEPVINVANTETVVRQQYYDRLAQLSKAAAPVFGSANATGRARSANKKVTSKFQYHQLADFQFNNVLDGLDDAFARSQIIN